MESRSDTSPDVERALLELARRTPAWRKLEILGELHSTVRELLLIGLRERHPFDPPEVLRRRLAEALLGADLAERAYPTPVERVGGVD
jgi:hypothetical protein